MKEQPAPTSAPAGAPATDWNELQFVSWREFKRMAPSILQLEITRMDALLPALGEDTGFDNDLVRARYCVRQFVACLERTDQETVEETCAPHLRAAIMSVSLPPAALDAEMLATCRYILDRLNYVYRRLLLIY